MNLETKQLSQDRDVLASERTLLAAERTLSAWIRTGLAGVAGGLALFMPGAMLSAAPVEYELTISQQAMNFTGQPVEAMTINGQLPGPTLRFTLIDAVFPPRIRKELRV